MRIWQREINLEILKARNEYSLSALLDIEFIEVRDDALLAKMFVNEKTRQPAGILHGGATCVLAESVGSTAANFCLPEDERAVGLEINCNHLRAKKEGYVVGVATPFHLGKKTQVWNIEVRDESENLIAISRLTMAILRREANG